MASVLLVCGSVSFTRDCPTVLSSVHLRRCDDTSPLSLPMDPFIVSADQVKLKFSGLCFDFFSFLGI